MTKNQPTFMRAQRRAAGLTLQECAIGTGVTLSTYHAYETGVRRTPPHVLTMFVRLIAQHRQAKAEESLAADAQRPTAELMQELVALKDLLRSVGQELAAGGDPHDLNLIGRGACERVAQISNALLARAPVASPVQ